MTISEKDKKDWQKFVESNEKITNKDTEVFKDRNRGLLKTIDLHGYSLYEANKKIRDLIIECFKNKIEIIHVITGKGLHSKNIDDPYSSKDLGMLKYSVPDYIKNDLDLMNKVRSINYEDVNQKNKGSFDIILKKNNS